MRNSWLRWLNVLMLKAAAMPAASSRKMNSMASIASSADIITVTTSENIAVLESKNTKITTGTAANGTRYMPLVICSNIRIANITNSVMKESRNSICLFEWKKRGL